MNVDFNSLSDESRIYIYPSSRKFYPQEIEVLNTKLLEFCQGVENVEMAYKLEYNRFVVFAVSNATPLSLEQQNGMVEFVQDLEKSFQLTLLDKVNVCYKQGEHVQLKEVPDFKKLVRNRSVSKKTIIFDNMLNSKAEFLSIWESPAERSWVAHFFK